MGEENGLSARKGKFHDGIDTAEQYHDKQAETDESRIKRIEPFIYAKVFIRHVQKDMKE